MDLTTSIGHTVEDSYNGGFVVLSMIVGFVGCWTALELLHKRTSPRGYYNWYLLLAAATAMGAVAIWSMHFIGNRAIEMGKGARELQIQYSPGYTAGSFFLPICVVGLAFYMLNMTDTVDIPKTLAGGILTGSAVCGMHYLGQGGINNYRPQYRIGFVVGSALISIAANTVALGVFFYFKSHWVNTAYRRASCAILLAVSVSAMHWVAAVGTSYQLRAGTGTTNGLSRQATVIVVLCLSLGCCVALFIFALLGQRSKARSADRAQQVVLACATFDEDGRIMVTPDGLLPCRKITNSYIERSFHDVFETDHPVFCWIYRASRSWQGIIDLIPGIRAHLRVTGNLKSSRPGTQTSKSDAGPPSTIEDTEDYSTLFRELFLVAASDLADSIQERLEDLGVLYEDMVSTGTLRKQSPYKFFSRATNPNPLDFVERGSPLSVFGRGQLLFVTRQADGLAAMNLQATGHRFANIEDVVVNLAMSMEISTEELAPHLEMMRKGAGRQQILAPGVHLACFALRPVVHRGFHVLVSKNAKHLLPTRALAVPKLEQWQRTILNSMDGWTVARCIRELRTKDMILRESEEPFAQDLLQCIQGLADDVQYSFFQEARLIARPFYAPCFSSNSQAPDQAVVIAFRCFADIHDANTSNLKLEFVPSRLFLAQQHVYRKTSDAAAFACKIRREFVGIAQSNLPEATVSISATGAPIHKPARAYFRFFWRRANPSGASTKWFPLRSVGRRFVPADNSSEHNLVQEGAVETLGGIRIVRQVNVTINMARTQGDSNDSEVRRIDPGDRAETSGSNVETINPGARTPSDELSYADRLMTFTLEDRRHQRQ